MRMLYFDVPASSVVVFGAGGAIVASGVSRTSRHRAEVAELADALASGASGRKPMKVRVLSSAPLDSAALRPRSWQADMRPKRVVP